MATELEVLVEGGEPEGGKWETTCWGCTLLLTLPRFEPVFKCGYCGAVTVHKPASKPRLRWQRRCTTLLDHVLVTFVFVLATFITYGGVWTIFPVLFPSHSAGFFLHSAITALLAFNTLLNFVLAAFTSAGPPPSTEWGHVDRVTRGALENHKLCSHCQKPKHPAAHHCRTCRACVMGMDHHCPFIGNCVGTNNHGYFILFLIFTLLSCLYVFAMGVYTFRVAPKAVLEGTPVGSFFSTDQTVQRVGLVYLLVIALALLVGVSLLLYQQLALVYQGQTFVDSLSSVDGGNLKTGWANLQRVLNKRNARSGSFRWTKFKQAAWKLSAVAVPVAILIWWNEQMLTTRWRLVTQDASVRKD